MNYKVFVDRETLEEFFRDIGITNVELAARTLAKKAARLDPTSYFKTQKVKAKIDLVAILQEVRIEASHKVREDYTKSFITTINNLMPVIEEFSDTIEMPLKESAEVYFKVGLLVMPSFRPNMFASSYDKILDLYNRGVLEVSLPELKKLYASAVKKHLGVVAVFNNWDIPHLLAVNRVAIDNQYDISLYIDKSVEYYANKKATVTIYDLVTIEAQKNFKTTNKKISIFQ